MPVGAGMIQAKKEVKKQKAKKKLLGKNLLLGKMLGISTFYPFSERNKPNQTGSDEDSIDHNCGSTS